MAESLHGLRCLVQHFDALEGFEVLKGELVAIVGRSGQGKSSLLGAILGDMLSAGGTKNVNGSIAYVPQQAWVFNATIRENILFGKPFDQRKYAEAIRASCLERDLRLMPGGDLTELGEKGVNMSGGQKQRLSIARAVYADADVVIMDDPLSALDAHVAKEVFEKCLCGVLKGKTRIFVTNRVEFCPSGQ